MRTRRVDTLGLLTKVEDLLSDPSHWTKGAYRRHHPDRDDEYCLLGAVIEVTPIMSERLELATALWEGISVHLGEHRGSIGLTTFNDARTTDHDDIMASIAKAKELVVAANPETPPLG